jgi:hypothetical protein
VWSAVAAGVAEVLSSTARCTRQLGRRGIEPVIIIDVIAETTLGPPRTARTGCVRAGAARVLQPTRSSPGRRPTVGSCRYAGVFRKLTRDRPLGYDSIEAGGTRMTQETIRQQIRERLTAGTLPRSVPPLIGGPGLPLTPQVHIRADTAIGPARCSACGDAGARVAYRYADGTIIRFHSTCHRMWEDECQRPVPRA